MRFLPLALATMRGKAVCVAGVDVDSGEWVRPVVRKYRCLFSEQAADFQPNFLYDLNLGAAQPRPHKEDPDARHTEDRVLEGKALRRRSLKPLEKWHILDSLAEPDFRAAILGGGRSLFLVRPITFRCSVDDSGAYRWDLTLKHTSFGLLRNDDTLEASHIGISGRGGKCTCPNWQQFAANEFGTKPITQEDIQRLPGEPRLYLTLSLSALKYEKYWLIAAGVHIVGKERIWL